MVSALYGVNIVGTAWKTRTGQIDWKEASDRAEVAKTSIHKNGATIPPPISRPRKRKWPRRSLRRCRRPIRLSIDCNPFLAVTINDVVSEISASAQEQATAAGRSLREETDGLSRMMSDFRVGEQAARLVPVAATQRIGTSSRGERRL